MVISFKQPASLINYVSVSSCQ